MKFIFGTKKFNDRVNRNVFLEMWGNYLRDKNSNMGRQFQVFRSDGEPEKYLVLGK